MRRTRHVFLLVIVMLSLAGCEKLFARPFSLFDRPPSDISLADEYVLNLTLAQLALVPPGGNVRAAEPHVKKLSAENDPRHPVSLTLLSLDYKTPPKNEKFALLAPVALNDEGNFPLLAAVLKRLAGAPYTLHDVHVHTILFAPRRVRWSWQDPALLHRQLQWRQKHIMADAKPLPPLVDAGLELRLTRFFMQQGVRDAAYLAMENTKAALAQATTQKAADPADIAALSKEAEAQEVELRKEMPYKF